MEEISDRIKAVRKALGLTQDEFSSRIAIKRNTLAVIETQKRATSDIVLKSICREFGVNEQWLRTGEGEMFVPMTPDEELSAFFGDVLRDDTGRFRRRLLAVLSRLNDDEWDLLERMAWKLVDEKENPAP